MNNELFINQEKKISFEDIFIIGLGKSGISSAKYLVKFKDFYGKNISISVYDKFKTIKEQKALLKDIDIDHFHTGLFKKEMCKENTLIVLSPGVDFDEDICEGIIINDIFLFLDYLQRISKDLSHLKIVGITGTNGKTSTCFFLEHLMNIAKLNVHKAGNIGLSPLEIIDDIKKDDIVILELSSFQLKLYSNITFPRKINIGIFLNFSEDHLDMHNSMEEYLNSKKNLLYNSERTILNSNLNEKIINEFKDIIFGNANDCKTKGKKSNYSVKYHLSQSRDRTHIADNKGFVIQVNKINIPGKHNLLNMMAGVAAFRCLGCNFDDYQYALSSFKGIPHRIEWIKNIHGINYFNDSKATNVASTVAALNSFNNKDIILIAGGDLKKQSLKPFIRTIKNNVKILILIGKDANIFKENTERLSNLKIEMCQSMNDAVITANNLAQKDDIVLLSPACASFDMYSNYIERGNHFKEVVNQIDS